MKQNYYLVGIGGISMSGIAKFLLAKKQNVTGSDIKKSEITKDLKKLGAKIYLGHCEKNITPEIDFLIYSSAAATESAPGRIEIEKAKKLKIPIFKRSVFIGKLMAEKFGIAVSGMHGKTTLTAMIGFILKKADFSPTVMLGGNFKDFNFKNLEMGKGKYFIAEACEYDRSFLDFQYQAGIILNIEEEHLDYFKGGLAEILKTFEEFIKKIPKSGFLVIFKDDKNIKKILKSAKCQIVKYSQKDMKDYQINLKVPGDFNKLNAIAAIKVCQELGVTKENAIKIINDFSGVERRFEYKGKIGKTKIYDDYAHHPTEIQTTLKAARKTLGGKILVIFQPHQYSRIKLLFSDLIKSFNQADQVIICDVYDVVGREEEKSVGSQDLVKALKERGISAVYTPTYNEAIDFLGNNFQKFDNIITMGAGPVNQVAEKFLKNYGRS